MELAGESDAGSGHGWSYLRRAKAYRALGDTEEAVADLDRAAKVNSTSVYLYIKVGSWLYRLGERDKAFAAYQRAEEVNPNNVYIYEHRVSMHLDAGHYQNALAEINRALQLGPRRWWVYKRRAKLHFYLGQYKPALDDLKQALELNPTDLSTVMWISPEAMATSEKAEFREGVKRLADHAVEVNGGSHAALGVRATLLSGFGEWEAARQDLEAMLDLEAISKTVEAHYYTPYRAALLSLALDDMERYRQLSQRMVASFSDSKQPQECHFTGWTCALAPDTLEDYSAVLSIVQRAVERDPENQQYLTALGAVRMRAGQYEKALDSLNRANTTANSENTSNAYAAYFRSMTLAHLGRTTEFQKALDAANELAERELNDESNPPAWNRKLTLEILREEARARQ